MFRRSFVSGVGCSSVLRGEERRVVLQRGAIHQFCHLQHIYSQYYYDDDTVRFGRNTIHLIFFDYPYVIVGYIYIASSNNNLS